MHNAFSLIWNMKRTSPKYLLEKHQQKLKKFNRTFQGKIVPARGEKNFGWDPIFEPDGFNQTYAEMDGAIKNTISHRARALQEMVTYFEKQK